MSNRRVTVLLLTIRETRRDYLRFAKQRHSMSDPAAPALYSRHMVAVAERERAIVERRIAIPESRSVRRQSPSTAVVIAALGAWLGTIVLGRVLFERLQASGANFQTDAGPLHGFLDSRVTPRLLVPVVVGVLIILTAPRATRRWRWRALLVASVFAAGAWAISLALVDGWAGLTMPLEARTEYLADIPSIGSPGAFLSTFVDRISEYSTHVQGHPPGMVLLLTGLDRIGLGGSGVAAALVIAGGAAAAPAVLVTVRELAGEATARRAAPFVVLAPIGIWIASSADALYAGVGTWAVALIVLATGRRDRRGDAFALVAGAVFGLVAFLSYGLVLLVLIPIVVARRRRRLRPLLLGVVGTLPIFGFFAIAGFSWFAGLLATRERYFAGIASRRPYLEYLALNAAAFAIALGPAMAVALARLRDRRLVALIAGVLLAVGVAMFSGMSKGEVERIWLPFAVFLLPACAVLATGRDTGTRGWLALQGAAALTVASLVKTSW